MRFLFLFLYKFTEYFLEELFEENENLFSLLTAQLNEQG